MSEKNEYLTIAGDAVIETQIKKSRFLTHFKRIKNEEEAKEFINQIKKEHWKANHNCSAFILGKNMEIQRSSDDGEPSGTAGVPMLEVLKKNQLIDVLVIVTRYFGGIKLGAGGLIRAYSGSVSNAIEEIGILRGVLQQEIEITISYPNLGKVQNFLEENPQYTLGEIFYQDQVKALIFVEQTGLEELERILTNLLNGNVKITKKDIKRTEIPYKKCD